MRARVWIGVRALPDARAGWSAFASMYSFVAVAARYSAIGRWIATATILAVVHHMLVNIAVALNRAPAAALEGDLVLYADGRGIGREQRRIRERLACRHRRTNVSCCSAMRRYLTF
ncbi:MAG: hypothetical protein EOP89_09095 [Lysobacteraceae bacterium]|nr:MAG: hypothetical protein EOP89_09095 [Xanthomonadaceae bacterium]